MSHDLEKLAQNRDALLLTEVAAWLHDMGKCTDAFLQPDGAGFDATSCQGSPRVNPHKAIFELSELSRLVYWSELSPNRGQCSRLEEAQHYTALWKTLKKLSVNPTSLDLQITLPGLGKTTVRELVLWGRPLVSDQYRQFQRVLGNWAIMAAYLGRAHGAAHIEKEESGGIATFSISSPFGFESVQLGNLDEKLEKVLHSLVSYHNFQRSSFIDDLKKNFILALGDTRCPENEVTLWDWSSTVAALYKAALAGALLGCQPQPNDLRWRLLSIRVDSESFYGRVARLPDLLARQRLQADAFERVRTLLEEKYPLGTRVYQDEDSSVYVVPNLTDLLNATNSQGAALEELVRGEFAQGTIANDPQLALSGETITHIEVDPKAWWGQRPDYRNQPATADEVPPIANVLQQEILAQTDAQAVASWWPDNINRDICPVCGLRPQAAPDTKAGKRNVCDVCEQRRASRAKKWTQHFDTTIWTDEVADANGRLALIVGQFDLDKWLDGTMVQTLAVTDPASGNPVVKNPSFARLRRVWETTRAFWQSALNAPDPDGKLVLHPAGPRLEIRGNLRPRVSGDTLGLYHTYELILGRVRLSVVWDSDKQRFITCDNLDYLAKPEQLGKSAQQAIQETQTIRIEEPAGYGSKNKKWGEITVEQVKELSDQYTPAIPILAEPRTFMALVPANKALEVVEAIRDKYEREMSKVRNRLPLTLGVVYFGRRTPLAAALDAGRRMLNRKQDAGSNNEQEARSNSEQDARSKWQVASAPGVSDEWVDVTLQGGARKITVRVSTVMGDKTPDVWYPYWRVENSPTGRKRQFTGPDGEHWVHVCDLRPDDKVAFTPSTFDFEYLDTTARRFEVNYDGGQRRGADKRQRPYLLEELEQLEQVWDMLKPPEATSQVRGLATLIETKRADWQKPTGDAALALPEGDPFRQLCRDALKNTAWRSEKKDFGSLERTALSGMLADALELHLTIAKEGDDKKEEAN